MTEPNLAYTPEEAARAERGLSSGTLTPEQTTKIRLRLEEFKANNRLNPLASQKSALGPTGASLGQPEGIGAGTKFEAFMQAPEEEPVPKNKEATRQGYDIDLTRPDVIRNIANDAKRAETIAKIREETVDKESNTASRLKVMSAPADYSPKQQTTPNPFSALPEPPKDRRYFYEPSVEQFKGALSNGALRKHLDKEFPGIDPFQLIEKDLQNSKTFAVFKDAAWKSALAEAVKTGTPISRVEYSKELGPLEKGQAKALDYVTAAGGGFVEGASAGLSNTVGAGIDKLSGDDTFRSMQLAEGRHPTVAAAGSLAGAFSPRGITAQVMKGASNLLKYPASKGGEALAKGIGVGTVTSAIDANIRAIADAAAQALEANDSAIEAAERVYNVMTPEQVAERSMRSGAFGALTAGGGHVLGQLAGSGARGLLRSNDIRPVVAEMDYAGGKISPGGKAVYTEPMTAARGRAENLNVPASMVVAEDIAPKMASTRVQQLEGSARKAVAETEALKAKLGDMAIPSGPLSMDLLEHAKSLNPITSGAIAKAKELRRVARMIRRKEFLSPDDLDIYIKQIDDTAKAATGKPDPDYSAASAIMRNHRDAFVTGEPTTPIGQRDEFGNVKPTQGWSAMKARQENAIKRNAYMNTEVGLPERKIEGLPINLKVGIRPGMKNEEVLERARAVGDSTPPQADLSRNEWNAFIKKIAASGGDSPSAKAQMQRLAKSSGVSDNLALAGQLRAAENWDELVSMAVNTIASPGGAGGYAKVKKGVLLRALPALKTMALRPGETGLEGLPGEAGDILSRHMENAAPGRAATDLIDRFLARAVPAKTEVGFSSLGRLGGELGAPERNQSPPLTPEEAEVAGAIITSLIEMSKK